MNRVAKFIAYAIAIALLAIPASYLVIGLIYFGLLVMTGGNQ